MRWKTGFINLPYKMDPYQAFSALASVVVNEYRTSQAMWFLWMANLQAANSQQEEIDGCMSMDQSEMYAVLKMPRFIGKRYDGCNIHKL